MVFKLYRVVIQTDRQMSRGKTICLPTLKWGDIIPYVVSGKFYPESYGLSNRNKITATQSKINIEDDVDITFSWPCLLTSGY